MSHKVYHGAVVGCIDGDWIEPTLAITRRLAGGHRIDPYMRPGGTKRHCRACKVTQEVVEDLAKITVANHGALNLYLVHHANCLAYGGREAFASEEAERSAHIMDLRTAKQLFTEEVLAYAELLLKHERLSDREKVHLEVALDGGFAVTPIFLAPPERGRVRTFTPAECRALIIND